MNKRIEMSRVFDSMYQKYTDVFNDFLNFETRKPYEIIKKTDTDNRRKLNEHSDKILNCYVRHLSTERCTHRFVRIVTDGVFCRI